MTYLCFICFEAFTGRKKLNRHYNSFHADDNIVWIDDVKTQDQRNQKKSNMTKSKKKPKKSTF